MPAVSTNIDMITMPQVEAAGTGKPKLVVAILDPKAFHPKGVHGTPYKGYGPKGEGTHAKGWYIESERAVGGFALVCES